MDARYYRIRVACDTLEFEFILLSPESIGVVHLTRPSWTMWHLHAQTFDKWHVIKKKNKNKKVALHILTRWCNEKCDNENDVTR